jgi:hypothetical protein
MSESTPRYRFQGEPRADSERARVDALADARTLLARLEPEGDVASVREHPLLVRYAMDVPLNIAWYERAKLRASVRQGWSMIGVLCFGLCAMGATAIPTLWKPSDATEASITTAQIAIFVAMAYGVLQVIASLTDQKQKIAGFAKASADLKEGLFTFEETWRGKPLLCDGELEPGFASALLQEIANARRITREERDAYFASRPSTTEVAGVLGTAIDAVGRGAQSYGALRQTQAELRVDDKRAAALTIASERQRLIEAKAVRTGRRKRVELLRATGDAEAIAAAARELLDAEAIVVEAQARFDMSIKGDMLNPR